MIYFAEASNTVSDPVLIATLAFAGTLIAGFFKVIQNQTRANEELSKGIELMAKNSEKIAKAQVKVAEAIEKGNREAKQRNGHLGEQSEKIVKLIIDSKKEITDVVQNIEEQHVEHQHITEVNNDSK